MQKAISLHSLIPVRAEAAEAAEQLTQMLFAETCDVLSEQPRWVEIRLHTDGQQGWVDRKMLTPLSDEEFTSVEAATNGTVARVKMPMAYAVSDHNHQTFPLTASTILPNYREGSFSLLGATFHIDPAMVADSPLTLDSVTLMQTLRFFLNIPYLWGGKNAMGLDCSGLTQVVMSLFGRVLPRNASEQVREGSSVATLSEAKAGDLVFFDHADQDPKKTHISHVGILLDSERVCHCSGRVKVERIDDKGIFSHEQADASHPEGIYTHHLASIRRL